MGKVNRRPRPDEIRYVGCIEEHIDRATKHRDLPRYCAAESLMGRGLECLEVDDEVPSSGACGTCRRLELAPGELLCRKLLELRASQGDEEAARRILRENRVSVGPDDSRTYAQIACSLGLVSLDLVPPVSSNPPLGSPVQPTHTLQEPVPQTV